MVKDSLYHSGVKGMRWGIRRFQNEDGTLTEEGKARYAKKESRKAAKKKPESAIWKSRDAKNLSDDELNRRNSRLQRENQYKQLTQSRGQRAAKWIAKTAGAVLVASLIGTAKGKMSGIYRQGLDKVGPKTSEIFTKYGSKAVSTVIRRGQG